MSDKNVDPVRRALLRRAMEQLPDEQKKSSADRLAEAIQTFVREYGPQLFPDTIDKHPTNAAAERISFEAYQAVANTTHINLIPFI